MTSKIYSSARKKRKRRECRWASKPEKSTCSDPLITAENRLFLPASGREDRAGPPILEPLRRCGWRDGNMKIWTWEMPSTTADTDYIIPLVWCPLVQDYVETARCLSCPYAAEKGECGYDC